MNIYAEEQFRFEIEIVAHQRTGVVFLSIPCGRKGEYVRTQTTNYKIKAAVFLPTQQHVNTKPTAKGV